MRMVKTAVGRIEDKDAKVIGYERLLKSDPRDSVSAGKLRDLYLEIKIGHSIREDHSDIHEEDENSGRYYCCYEDYSDHDDITYYVEGL